MKKLLPLLLYASAAFTQTQNMTTRAWDNWRTGTNQNETILTPASVVQKGLVRDFNLPMEGDRVGMEASPLFLRNVKLADGTTRDVVYQFSMNGTVWAYDANNSDDLWMRKIVVPVCPSGNPVNCASTKIDMHLINDHWSILATPVIDPDTQTIYILTWRSADQSLSKADYAFIEVDASTGNVLHITPLDGLQYKTQKFSSLMRKCRSSLGFDKNGTSKTVFAACGTIYETQSGAAGWMVAYDVATKTVTGITSSLGDGAGIWMGGQGPVIYHAPNGKTRLYVVTGNGSFNGVDNFAESDLIFEYTPPQTQQLQSVSTFQYTDNANKKHEVYVREPLDKVATSPASFAIVGWQTPWTDEGRVGGSVTGANQMLRAQNHGPSGISLDIEQGKEFNAERAMPVNGMHHPDFVKSVKVTDENSGIVSLRPDTADKANNAAYSDEDRGSAQSACLQSLQICISTGKDGVAYSFNLNNPPNTKPNDLLNAKTNVYGKMPIAPFWATNYPGNFDPAPQNPTALNFLAGASIPGGRYLPPATRHEHATPVQFGNDIFLGGENSTLHGYRVSANSVKFIGETSIYASPNCGTQGERCTATPGGMTGWMCSGSSNKNAANTKIVWCTIPYGDANAEVTYGRLVAVDATTLNADGTLHILWNSEKAAIPFKFNKFLPPIANGGKVYLPTYDDQSIVFRLGN